MDYYARPLLPPDKLNELTNTLARWLPGGGETAVSTWSLAEWEAAEWVVYWHNALPWLVARIWETGVQPPPAVRERLFALDADSRERTRRMLNNCVELLQALEQIGIPAIPLKGAVLAAHYYPDPLQRPMADLDILIHQKDLKRTVEVVYQLGYEFYSRSAEDEVFVRGTRQKNVWAADNVHPLEVHYTLLEEYAGIGYELAPQLWQWSQKRPFYSPNSPLTPHSSLLTPPPSVLLHHVCAHATSDWLIQRGRLMQIDDIRKIAAKLSEADWATFETLVPPHGARFVYPALGFTLKYAPETAVPPTTIHYLRTNCPAKLLEWVDNGHLAENSESNPISRSGIGFDLAAKLSRNRTDKLAFWLRSLFPRRQNLTKRYPRLVNTPFWPLCYVLINTDRLYHVVRKRVGNVKRET